MSTPYVNKNKMLLQASAIDKQWFIFTVDFCVCVFWKYQSLPPCPFQNMKPNQDPGWFVESGRLLKAIV